MNNGFAPKLLKSGILHQKSGFFEKSAVEIKDLAVRCTNTA
jgi:hypothetical protein